jgi:hypothetical protein
VRANDALEATDRSHAGHEGVDYLTDGVRLYEVIVSNLVQNYGLRGGSVRYAVVRDCRTEEERAMSGVELSSCRLVKHRGGRRKTQH